MVAEVDELLEPGGVPPGVLRILARHDGTQILIVHGDEREIEQGETLAHEEGFASCAVAEAVSHFCSGMLQTCRPASRDGWHDFPAANLPVLLRQARNQLNVTYFPDVLVRERKTWSMKRVARLGFLAGLGWTAKAIAADPLVDSTPGMVYRQSRKVEVALSEAPQGQVVIRMPASELAIFDRAARAARLTREAFIRSFLIRGAATL